MWAQVRSLNYMRTKVKEPSEDCIYRWGSGGGFVCALCGSYLRCLQLKEPSEDCIYRWGALFFCHVHLLWMLTCDVNSLKSRARTASTGGAACWILRR